MPSHSPGGANVPALPYWIIPSHSQDGANTPAACGRPRSFHRIRRVAPTCRQHAAVLGHSIAFAGWRQHPGSVRPSWIIPSHSQDGADMPAACGRPRSFHRIRRVAPTPRQRAAVLGRPRSVVDRRALGAENEPAEPGPETESRHHLTYSRSRSDDAPTRC